MSARGKRGHVPALRYRRHCRLNKPRQQLPRRRPALPGRSIKPAARDYYVRWAESWTKAQGHQSAERTQAYFDALGRSASIADWQQPRGTEGFWTERSVARRARRRAEPPSQFRQALDAARILACDVLTLSWASAFNWHSLADQARSLEPDHRTLARESIQVRAQLPSSQPPSPQQAANTETELTHLIDALRRAVRLKGHAVSTEETYVYWNRRFIRFCHQKLGQSPKAVGPPAVTAYLDFLALERNVAPATQKQALNAMAFLVKNIFGIEQFTLDHYTPGRGQRRPPVVMTREEVRSVFARLEDPWKLIAQVMYGSGLRLMEAMRLRVKDLDFGQASSHQWDYARASHHYVPIRLSTRQH